MATIPAEQYLPPGRHVIHKGVTLDPEPFPSRSVDRVEYLHFRPDDVFIPGYCKTGTTWVQEMVWLICNGVDVDTALTVPQFDRVMMLELELKDRDPYIDQAINKQGPRIMTTHLPRRLFAEQLSKCKPYIINPVRNPKDTLVSYYYFYNQKIAPHHIPTFKDFFELHRHDKLWMDGYFPHVHAWYTNKEEDGTLVVKYEDLKKNHRGQILRMAKYLNKELTDAQVDTILQHTSFANMKARPEIRYGKLQERCGRTTTADNVWVRRGVVGGWKEYFTVEQSEYVDKQYQHWLQDTGLQFEYVP